MNPAEDLGSAIAYSFGSSIAYALLWWPVCFAAAKGSLHLTYRWRPFVSGFFWCVVVLATFLLISTKFIPHAAAQQDFDGAKLLLDMGQLFLLPIGVCVSVAFALRGRFVQATRRESTVSAYPHSPVPTSNWLPKGGASLKNATGAWIACATLVGILGSAMYPPWMASVRGVELRLGHGTFFTPPSYQHYARIDYPLLATQCIAIVALGGIAGVLAHLYRRSRAGGNANSVPLLDDMLINANKLIVVGFRRIGAEQGCAPTKKTSDDQIVDIYRKVATNFQKVAEMRGERLKAGLLNTIVLKFFQVKEKMGDAFVEEHLEYELEKYRSEGLRPEYQRELRLF